MILLDAEGNEIQRQLFTENELQNTGVIQKTLATSITSKQSKDGNGIGSILGHATGSTPVTIENCIVKVEYVWTGGGPRLNGGILGLSQSSNTILKNNVSLATGTVIYKVYGSSIDETSTNNYELEESTLVSNSSGEIVKTVSQNNVTSEFFKNDASFDENIWNLSGVSYNNLPTLKNDDPNKKENIQNLNKF